MSSFTPPEWFERVEPYAHQADALVRIQAASARPGLTIVTGAAGTGKSLAVRLAARDHPGRVATVISREVRDLRDAVAQVRDELGVVQRGDLVIFDDINEMRSALTAPEFLQLGDLSQLGAAHVIITTREASAAVLAARLSIIGEPFPPRWVATGEPGTLISFSWSPDALDAALRQTIGLEHAEVMRQVLGNPDTPQELLHRVHEFLAQDYAAVERPDVLIVPDASGRLRVEPATRLPTAQVQLHPGSESVAPWLIFQRSRGIWLPAADALEELINDPSLREQDLQDFFERHPHLLLRDGFARLIPHPVLSIDEGDLIPDFMLEPVGLDAANIVELKLPSERVVVGRGKRLKLAEGVMSAVAQVREYRAFFDDPTARSAFRDRYGVEAYRPHAAVLIGREPAGADPLQLRRIWTELPGGVQVSTYDELVRKIRRLGTY